MAIGQSIRYSNVLTVSFRSLSLSLSLLLCPFHSRTFIERGRREHVVAMSHTPIRRHIFPYMREWNNRNERSSTIVCRLNKSPMDIVCSNELRWFHRRINHHYTGSSVRPPTQYHSTNFIYHMKWKAFFSSWFCGFQSFSIQIRW